MDNQKIDDKRISELVRTVKFKIPVSVEERVDETLEKATLKKARTRQSWQSRPSWLWYPMPAAAMLVIIAALFMFHFLILMDSESWQKKQEFPLNTPRPLGAPLSRGDKDTAILGAPVSAPLKGAVADRRPVRGAAPTGAFLGRAASPPDPVTPISEIKTEFELKDKNIKILWVQKRDFTLNLKD